MESKGQRQAGFSMIELLVVVGILAIIAAIAVPSYQAQVLKSRQAEAQAHLTGLYTSMKNFLAERWVYCNDFTNIGYNPDGPLMYTHGFNRTVCPVPGLNPRFCSHTGINNSIPAGCASPPAPQAPAWSHSNWTRNINFLGAGDIGGGGTTFRAWALGETRSGNTLAQRIDSWSIDDRKNLRWGP